MFDVRNTTKRLHTRRACSSTSIARPRGCHTAPYSALRTHSYPSSPPGLHILWPHVVRKRHMFSILFQHTSGIRDPPFYDLDNDVILHASDRPGPQVHDLAPDLDHDPNYDLQLDLSGQTDPD